MNQLLKKTPAVIRQCIAVMLCMAVIFTALTAGLGAMINRVKIIDSGFFKIVYTLSTNPSSILSNAGIKLDSEDTYSMNWLNGREGELILKRALEVSVTYGDKTVSVSMPNATVAEAIEKAGFELTDDMVLNCSVNSSITDGMAIEIYDVITEEITEQVAIPFETVTQKSSKVANGELKTTVEGKDGIKEITYSCTVINGEVVSKTAIGEQIISEPVNRKVIVGTKTTSKTTASTATSTKPSSSGSAAADTDASSDSGESSADEGDSTVYYTKAGYKYVSSLKPSTDFKLDENGIPVNYKKVIKGKATAYSYSAGSVTATGKKVRTGYIAVNPKQIPYGTKMFIRSSDGKYIYGYASAEDTGGFAKSGNIIADLFFSSDSACYKFGVRNIEIYILD